jgi:hypothetical protein
MKTTNTTELLFRGQLTETLTNQERKKLFEQCFICLIRLVFKTYRAKFVKMPRGFTDILNMLPKTESRSDVEAIAQALFAASMRDCRVQEIHPRLFTILFCAFSELAKHSHVYTTHFYHTGIGYVAEQFIEKYLKNEPEAVRDEILYDNFAIFGNIVRGYVEGEFIEIMSKPAKNT